MKPLSSHSIIEALAIGTVPVVGAFLIWALWPVHGTIIEVHGTVAEVHQGVDGARKEGHGLATKVATALDGVPSVLTHAQTATDAATGVLQAAVPVVASFKDTGGKLNAAVDLTSHRLNDLCPVPGAVDAAIHPCGTLADFNRTLSTLRGTSGQVEYSLRVFNQHEGDLFTQESTAYEHMDTAVQNLNLLVSDPDLKASVHNAATITSDVAGITTDGRFWFHQKLFPTKKRGFVSGFEATGDVAKHWMPSIF
jgi:uncharacterized protein YoxC